MWTRGAVGVMVVMHDGLVSTLGDGASGRQLNWRFDGGFVVFFLFYSFTMLCATDSCQVPPEYVANSAPVLSVCFASFNSAPNEGGGR